MAKTNIEELTKKIASLNDLKESIQLVKAHMMKCEHGIPKLEKCAECEKMPKQEVKKSDSLPKPQSIEKPSEGNGLKIIGVEPKGNGEFCHTIGMPGSLKMYKIMVDTKPMNHLIVVHHHIGDDPHSISPIAYKSLDHAAKSIVNHFHKGEW